MFDYKGYSEEKLVDLCDESTAFKGFSKWEYWTSEVYSFGTHLRDYGYYPSFLPIMGYCDHGVGDDAVYKHELENDANCMFVFSEKKRKDYTQKSNKPCYCILPPFIWYRRKNNIKPLKTAKGTLAFPAHTTPEIDDVSNIQNYIEQLKSLPDEFQPVCVCLHMHDVNKGQHKLFLEHDIPVYTVGNAFDQRFAERFYNILKNFKYSTSNMIGSYSFYSVEMGIPFSVYGDGPTLMNNSDTNLQRGEFKYLENESYKTSNMLFFGLNKNITKEQKEYIELSLNLNNYISRFKMANILYSTYIKHGNLIKDLFLAIKYGRKYLKLKMKEGLKK